MKRLLIAPLFDSKNKLSNSLFSFFITNFLLDNNYLGILLLPFRIINNGNPTSIRLPSINKKVFRLINPFHLGYPKQEVSLFWLSPYSFHPSLFWFCCSRPTLLDHQNQGHIPWSRPDKFYAFCKNLKSYWNNKQFKDNIDIQVKFIKKFKNLNLEIN